jgi:hypothetical protein
VGQDKNLLTKVLVLSFLSALSAVFTQKLLLFPKIQSYENESTLGFFVGTDGTFE